MASIWELGDGPEYDIVDIKVARNNGDGTFGTALDVPSVDRMSVRWNVKSAQARGDGRITALASQIESANVIFRGFSMTQDVWAMMLGLTSYTDGTTPTRTKSLKVSNNRFKTFGICGKALVGDSADAHIFLPYLRIMEQVEFNIEYNGFIAPEVTAMAIGDPVLLNEAGDPLLWQIKRHETATAVVIPIA